jgi:hypothetical protein
LRDDIDPFRIWSKEINMHLFPFSVSTAFLLLAPNKQGKHGECSTHRRRQQRQRLSSDDHSTAEPTQKYDNLLKWLKSKKGAQVSEKVAIQYSGRGGGFGAFVTAKVEEGEILFTVPRQACISLEDAIRDESAGGAFQSLIQKAGSGGNTVVMAGFIAREWLKVLEDMKNGKDIGDSAFGPYLHTLPWDRGVNSQEHVLYWSDEDVESSLKGSLCYPESKTLREEVALATKVMNGMIGKAVREYRGEEVDAGFMWPWEVRTENTNTLVEGLKQAMTGAFVSLLTRAFQDGEGDAEKLVPLLDMLQHSDEPNVSHAMRQTDRTVEVRARKALQAGDELLNQYRSEMEETMPYHRFFSRYGFVPGIQEPIQNLLNDKSSIFFARKSEV